MARGIVVHGSVQNSLARLNHIGFNINTYIASREHASDMTKLRQGALPWLRRLPKRFQDELEGMAEGANLPLQRLAEWSYIEECEAIRCSAVAGLLDKHTWIARNNDSYVPEVRSFRRLDYRNKSFLRL